MNFADINPYLRYAALQPAVLEGKEFRASYDFRIFYVIDGCGKLIINNEPYEIAKGSAMCFPYGTAYCFDGKLKVIVLNFDLTREHAAVVEPLPPDYISDYVPDKALYVDVPDELSVPICINDCFDIEEKMSDILGCYPVKDCFSDAKSSAIIKDIISWMFGRRNKTHGDCLLEKTISYVKMHSCENITNKSVAKFLGYNHIYVERVFVRSMGETLHSYILKTRMRVAKNLLSGTSLSIEEIADECGFSDRSQFSTAFKRTVGTSPAGYRKIKR